MDRQRATGALHNAPGGAAIPLTADRRSAVAGKRRAPRPNSKTSPVLCCSTSLQRCNRTL